MDESLFPVILLGTMTVCLLAITVTMVSTARAFRAMLRRLEALLPDADQALRDVPASLRHVRRLLARADWVTEHIESIIHQACDTTSRALEDVSALQRKAQGFFATRFGNGARVELRSHHRRR